MACYEKEKLRRLLVVCGHFMYHQTHQGGGQAAVLTLLQKDGPMTQKALQESWASAPAPSVSLWASWRRSTCSCGKRTRQIAGRWF